MFSKPEKCFQLISEFFRAVSLVFKDEWDGHKPKTSRLVHGAGIVAMGYIMELLALNLGSKIFKKA